MNDQLLDDIQMNTNKSEIFKTLNFPISFQFKIGTISNDFIATDANGNQIAYVRQKMFKFKEDVIVFADESRKTELYRIQADRWIDFNASYSISKAEEAIGSMGRKGMRSLWKSSYVIFDPEKKQEYSISEENPWAKVGDTLLGEVPFLSVLTGYLFNPKYMVLDPNENKVARLSKEPSFFGRKFKLDALTDIPVEDGERMMLSLMMMVLLERRRG